MLDDNIVFFEEFYHEIVNYLPVLNKSSDIIIDGVVDRAKIDFPNLEYHTQVIKDLVELINLNSTMLNLSINPEFYTFQQKEYIDFIPLFKRATKILKLKSDNRKIKLEIEGDTFPNIFALPIIKLIPYIILDNCIKYSPAKQTIEVEYIKADSKHLEIIITSMGPYVPLEEIPKLKEKFYRGNNTVNTNTEGKGLGLYLLDQICKLSNVGFQFISEDKCFALNGVNYSTIIQKITIDK